MISDTVPQILYDFSVTFKDVDVEALRRKWPSIRDKIDSIQNSQIDYSTVPVRNVEVIIFLRMFKLFKTNRQFFSNAVKSFVLFCEVYSVYTKKQFLLVILFIFYEILFVRSYTLVECNFC